MSPDTPDLLEPELEQRLRHALTALAAETPAPRPAYRRRLPAAAAAVAVLLAGGIVGVQLAGWDGAGKDVARPRPTLGSTQPPPARSGITYDLDRLTAESERIVVGSVTSVENHGPSDATGGLAYVLATVEVDDVVKGPATAQVVAFDYDYGEGVVTDGALGATFVRGERVLLFLASSAGTVHADLAPVHWQVTGGAQGEYLMNGDEPAAPFTMAQVRAAAGG